MPKRSSTRPKSQRPAVVGAAIAGLPQQERLILALHYHERLAADEQAALLQIPPREVTRAVARAVSTVQRELRRIDDQQCQGEQA